MTERILKVLKARETTEQERLNKIKQRPTEIKRIHEANTRLLSASGAYDLLGKINSEILEETGRVFLVENAQITHTHFSWGAYHDSAPTCYSEEHLYSYCLLSCKGKGKYSHIMIVAQNGLQEVEILGSVDKDAEKQWQIGSRALPCEGGEDSPDGNCHFKSISRVDFSGVSSEIARKKLEEELAEAFLRVTSPDRLYGGFGPST
jgi:hypothetical protein